MFQRRATQFVIAAFVLSRLIALAFVTSEPYLVDAIERYPQPQPYLVCAPSNDVYVSNTATYAVIPSILTLPDAPCAPIQSR